MCEPSSLLEAQVRRIVARFALPVPIERETRLHEDLGLDWIHLIEISSAIEDELLAPIPECELNDHMVTFGDFVTLAGMAVAAASAARRVA